MEAQLGEDDKREEIASKGKDPGVPSDPAAMAVTTAET